MLVVGLLLKRTDTAAAATKTPVCRGEGKTMAKRVYDVISVGVFLNSTRGSR